MSARGWMRRAGVSAAVLLTTHLLDDAERLADDVASSPYAASSMSMASAASNTAVLTPWASPSSSAITVLPRRISSSSTCVL